MVFSKQTKCRLPYSQEGWKQVMMIYLLKTSSTPDLAWMYKMGLDKKIFLDTFTGKETEPYHSCPQSPPSLAVGAPGSVVFVLPIIPFSHVYVSSQLEGARIVEHVLWAGAGRWLPDPSLHPCLHCFLHLTATFQAEWDFFFLTQNLISILVINKLLGFILFLFILVQFLYPLLHSGFIPIAFTHNF